MEDQAKTIMINTTTASVGKTSMLISPLADQPYEGGTVRKVKDSPARTFSYGSRGLDRAQVRAARLAASRAARKARMAAVRGGV